MCFSTKIFSYKLCDGLQQTIFHLAVLKIHYLNVTYNFKVLYIIPQTITEHP